MPSRLGQGCWAGSMARLGDSGQWDEEPGLQYSEGLCERGGGARGDQYSPWREHFPAIRCWIATGGITCSVGLRMGLIPPNLNCLSGRIPHLRDTADCLGIQGGKEALLGCELQSPQLSTGGGTPLGTSALGG